MNGRQFISDDFDRYEDRMIADNTMMYIYFIYRNLLLVTWSHAYLNISYGMSICA